MTLSTDITKFISIFGIRIENWKGDMTLAQKMEAIDKVLASDVDTEKLNKARISYPKLLAQYKKNREPTIQKILDKKTVYKVPTSKQPPAPPKVTKPKPKPPAPPKVTKPKPKPPAPPKVTKPKPPTPPKVTKPKPRHPKIVVTESDYIIKEKKKKERKKKAPPGPPPPTEDINNKLEEQRKKDAMNVVNLTIENLISSAVDIAETKKKAPPPQFPKPRFIPPSTDIFAKARALKKERDKIASFGGPVPSTMDTRHTPSWSSSGGDQRMVRGRYWTPPQ
jgi:hypothetical protein